MPACIYAHHICTWCLRKSEMGVRSPGSLELQIVGNHYEDTGNQIRGSPCNLLAPQNHPHRINAALLSGILNYTGLFSCLKIAQRILSASCSFTSLCCHFLLLMVLLPPAGFLLHPLSPQAKLRKWTTGVARITSARARAGWESLKDPSGRKDNTILLSSTQCPRYPAWLLKFKKLNFLGISQNSEVARKTTGSHPEAHASLKLRILLPQLFKHWDNRHVLSKASRLPLNVA